MKRVNRNKIKELYQKHKRSQQHSSSSGLVHAYRDAERIAHVCLQVCISACGAFRGLLSVAESVWLQVSVPALSLSLSASFLISLPLFQSQRGASSPKSLQVQPANQSEKALVEYAKPNTRLGSAVVPLIHTLLSFLPSFLAFSLFWCFNCLFLLLVSQVQPLFFIWAFDHLSTFLSPSGFCLLAPANLSSGLPSNIHNPRTMVTLEKLLND